MNESWNKGAVLKCNELNLELNERLLTCAWQGFNNSILLDSMNIEEEESNDVSK